MGKGLGLEVVSHPAAPYDWQRGKLSPDGTVARLFKEDV